MSSREMMEYRQIHWTAVNTKVRAKTDLPLIMMALHVWIK